MARDDPKKPRQDIRNDGRPIPQEHHSARGDAPRNSGNLTRGSQLLNTQVLMRLQGIKMPVYIWLGVFVIAYSTTRHGPRATYPAAPVLAETVSPVPTAAKALTTSTVTGLPRR